MNNTRLNAVLVSLLLISGCAGSLAPRPRPVVWLRSGTVSFSTTALYKFSASRKVKYRVAMSPAGTAILSASNGQVGTTTLCVTANATVDISVRGAGSNTISLTNLGKC
jgi:hypothetical protein